MRKTIIGFMSTVSALVLLFSYHTSTNSQAVAGSSTLTTAFAPPPTGAAAPTTSSGATSSSLPPNAAGAPLTSNAPAAPSTNSTNGAGTGSSGTYTGDAVNTRWGLVQVQIIVTNGTITAAQAVQYPTANGKDRQINAYAVPQLNQEVTAAQSGSIDAVSGATVTSDGYIQSLQSAIDQANL